LAWVGSIPKRPQKVRVDSAMENVKKNRDSPRVLKLDIVVINRGLAAAACENR
jgi:hypothetical protein